MRELSHKNFNRNRGHDTIKSKEHDIRKITEISPNKLDKKKVHYEIESLPQEMRELSPKNFNRDRGHNIIKSQEHDIRKVSHIVHNKHMGQDKVKSQDQYIGGFHRHKGDNDIKRKEHDIRKNLPEKIKNLNHAKIRDNLDEQNVLNTKSGVHEQTAVSDTDTVIHNRLVDNNEFDNYKTSDYNIKYNKMQIVKKNNGVKGNKPGEGSIYVSDKITKDGHKMVTSHNLGLFMDINQNIKVTNDINVALNKQHSAQEETSLKNENIVHTMLKKNPEQQNSEQVPAVDISSEIQEEQSNKFDKAMKIQPDFDHQRRFLNNSDSRKRLVPVLPSDPLNPINPEEEEELLPQSNQIDNIKPESSFDKFGTKSDDKTKNMEDNNSKPDAKKDDENNDETYDKDPYINDPYGHNYDEYYNDYGDYDYSNNHQHTSSYECKYMKREIQKLLEIILDYEKQLDVPFDILDQTKEDNTLQKVQMYDPVLMALHNNSNSKLCDNQHYFVIIVHMLYILYVQYYSGII